jgi:predicted DCC family thiol-disulfide oxidoreductase YuxK
LPLRFVWLLMGVIYFFPGFWKLWNVGFSWTLSDNMRAQMHFKWIEFDGWTPALRIDHYPALCALVGIATIAFETTFLFLVFFDRLRPWLIVAGLAFHNLTNLFMRISFAPLQAMYASLVDWGPAFRRLGRRLYPWQLSVAYDGRCPISCRIIASLRVFDIFGRVTYTDSGRELASLDPQRRITVRMEQSDGAKRGHFLTDLPAWRALAARLPILWPALPFLFLVPEQTAHLLSRRFTHLCDDQASRQSPLRVRAVRSVRSASRISPVPVLGTFLLLVNVAFGVGGITNAWPFACYPAFDFRASEQCYALTVAVQRKDGQIIELDRSGLSPNLAPDRARGLQEALLAIQDSQDRRIHLRGLWELWQRNHPELGNVRAVWFYRDTLTTVPEERGRNPLRRELLLALPLPTAQDAR